MTILVKFLKDISNSNAFVDVYRDDIDGETLRGSIIELSNGILQVLKYSDIGEHDGVTFIRLSDVTRIRASGRELTLTMKLAELSKNEPSVQKFSPSSMWGAVEAVQEIHGYVTIFIENIDPDIAIIGELVEHDDDYVHLKEYGTMKTQDERDLILLKEEITRVDGEGVYEKTIRSIPKDQY